MATLAVQRVKVSGLTLTSTAASAGGDKFPPGDVVFTVNNTGASPCVVTIVTPGTVQGQPIGDVAVTVPAGGTRRYMGPFPAKDFAGSDGLVSVTYDQVTSVTVSVFSF